MRGLRWVPSAGEGTAPPARSLPLTSPPSPHPPQPPHHGESRHSEPWEKVAALFVVGTAGICYLASFREDTNPHRWARDEAEERLRRRAEGKPVLHGVNYAGVRYMRETGMIDPARADELEGGALAAPFRAPLR